MAAVLGLAAAGTLNLYDADGQRIGTARQEGSRLDVFDADSRRLGWGRCDQSGNCELFDMRGNRIGTVTRDGKALRLERRERR